MRQKRILILDDDGAIRFGMRDFLSAKGFLTTAKGTCREAEEEFRRFDPDAALIDLMLPDGSALDLLPRLKALNPAVPVIILTAHGSIDLAVKAMKEGAEQFLTKPVELPALLVVLERLLENRRNRGQQEAVKSRRARLSVDPFLGQSSAIRALAEAADRVRRSEQSVVVQGETGSGKSILARWLHENGPRAEDPFVDLNCAGLARDLLESELFGHERGAFTGAVEGKPGLLEIAQHGTVFLDEIGDMDPQVQAKLLIVVEEKRFRRLGDVRDRTADVRLVAATHQDLGQLVREKRFRSDLYFRINALRLDVPPLRKRPGDILLLARNILGQIGVETGRGELHLDAEGEAALLAYPWPGNVRELRNVLERAALFSDKSQIVRRHLHLEAPPGDEPDDLLPKESTLAAMERWHVERVLRREGNRVEKAAARLGIPRSSLYQKLKRYGIPASKV